MQLYELEKRMTMDVKFLAREYGIMTDNLIVNIQTSRGAYGHFARNQWMDKGGEKHEIAMNPDVFISETQILVTMIHELVHAYGYQNNIKTTSRGGSYHNKEFAKLAEEFGLIVEPNKKYGFITPHKGEEIEKRMKEVNKSLPYPITMDMYRISRERNMIRKSDGESGEKGESGENGEEPKRNRRYHNYTCPKCKTTIRCNEIKRFMCIECNAEMEIENEQKDD